MKKEMSDIFMENCPIVEQEKLDFSKTYFHGLLFPNAQNAPDLEKMVLEKILMHGKIVPRNKLPEILTEEELFALYMGKSKFNYNGTDCVSVARKRDTYTGNIWSKRYVNQTDRAFPLYCKRNISIILRSRIMWDYDCYGGGLAHHDRENNFMNGEIQVKDSISKEYFQGISYNPPYTTLMIEEMLKEDLNCSLTDDLLKLSELDFLKKYFSKQIMIEELLNKYGYDMGIFDILTGERIPSIEEEKKFIYTLKQENKR